VKKDLGAFIEKYIDDHTDDISALLLELIDETEEVTGLSRWSIGKVEGKLLQLLVKISGARNAIEIGTFTGYSALIIAEALPEDGRLITCETNPKHAEIALRYFRKSPQGSKIRLELKPAIETLRGIADNSVIFVDNVFWRNKIFKQPITNENARAIAAFNEKVKNDDRAEKVMLNVRDGVYLIRKK
jgi:caffeoyl-CoA O-methyltransferase